MARIAPLPWRRLLSTMPHSVGARLRSLLPLLHTRLAVPWVVGSGVAGFLLPYVLWGLTAPAEPPAQPRPPAGVEIQQVLTALHTALGRLPQEGPTPLALQHAEVTLHFVVQKGASPSGASAYRLVPLDTAVQARPEHVQTVTLRVLPVPALPPTRDAPGSGPPGARPPAEAGRQPSTLPKKDARP
jgi:hypothetical protein